MAAESESSSDGLKGLPAAYAAWRASELGQVTDALEQDLILDLLGPPAGLRILDVGCGDGVLALELAAKDASVVGIDASPEMIAVARDRAARTGKQARFEVTGAENLPFASGTFDVAVAVTVLCFAESAGAILREMARVLRPGGRLIIGELGRWSTWASVRRIKGWLGSPIWRQARFLTGSDLRRLALDAGFVDVSVKGAVFYPPIRLAARLLGPIDREVRAFTTAGAAFLALKAAKPRGEPQDNGAGFERA